MTEGAKAMFSALRTNGAFSFQYLTVFDSVSDTLTLSARCVIVKKMLIWYAAELFREEVASKTRCQFPLILRITINLLSWEDEYITK